MTEPKRLPRLQAVVSVSLAMHGSMVEEFGGQLVNDTVHLAILGQKSKELDLQIFRTPTARLKNTPARDPKQCGG